MLKKSMDMIGLNEFELELCDKLFWSVNTYWLDKDSVLASTGTQKLVDATCARLRDILAAVAESDNFHLFAAAERIMCQADLEHFERSQQDNPNASRHNIILRTLREGVDQMKEINDQLTLRDENILLFHRYSSGTRALKSEHDRHGLPRDGIRRLLSSHRTRLQNKNTGMDALSNEERDLIWRRQRNIQKAEQLYLGMQRAALGIDGKAKNGE